MTAEPAQVLKQQGNMVDMVFSLLPFFATRTVCILGSKQEEDNAVQSQRPEAAATVPSPSR